jgi:hypothetical protein
MSAVNYGKAENLGPMNAKARAAVQDPLFIHYEVGAADPEPMTQHERSDPEDRQKQKRDFLNGRPRGRQSSQRNNRYDKTDDETRQRLAFWD